MVSSSTLKAVISNTEVVVMTQRAIATTASTFVTNTQPVVTTASTFVTILRRKQQIDASQQVFSLRLLSSTKPD
ncbi:MAG: hypothetical protein KME22_02740 [Hassallia sp. WJT32-NPBG1]|nr:hypothetical protein [Hassallia sp. WJT32-NPBG1]